MGKDNFLTAKEIGKRIKAKGLQKLRWFCQMCEKQCRDENGFKCHINSEGHQRQMLLFNENANKILTGFSAEFKKGFINILSSRYGTRRVLANTVYQEYISDRYHVHMNATCWNTLTGFCAYLDREGECVVEDTERGLYITWIDQRPETLQRQALDLRRARRVVDEDERERAWIAQCTAASTAPARGAAPAPAPAPSPGASASAPAPSPVPADSVLVRRDTPTLTLRTRAAPQAARPSPPAPVAPKKRSLAQMMLGPAAPAAPRTASATAAPKSALELLMESEKEKKRRREARKTADPSAGPPQKRRDAGGAAGWKTVV